MDTKIAITGNTYPVKEKIKALGGTWDSRNKAWMVPASKADQAKALVAATPAQTAKRKYTASRGAWNGCSMGCRDGSPNPRCRECCFDEFDS